VNQHRSEGDVTRKKVASRFCGSEPEFEEREPTNEKIKGEKRGLEAKKRESGRGMEIVP